MRGTGNQLGKGGGGKDGKGKEEKEEERDKPERKDERSASAFMRDGRKE